MPSSGSMTSTFPFIYTCIHKKDIKEKNFTTKCGFSIMELEIVAHFTSENSSETHKQNVKFYKCDISKQHLIVKKYTQTVKTVALLLNYVLFIVVKFCYC